MRREYFTVDGIPDEYEVRSVDLTPSGRPVCTLTHKTDSQAEALLLFTDSAVPIPEDAVWRHPSAPVVSPPMVRCMDEERLLLHGSAARDPETETTNAHILNRTGNVEHSFNIGGPSEVLANDNWIVTHYNDQAMTSDDYPVDREGLAVFDTTGTLLWGFESHFAGKPRLDVFFHAATWVAHDEIAVYRDIDRGFRTEEGFILLDLRERTLKRWRLPKDVHHALALTVLGDRAMFHGAKEGRGEGDIAEWSLGTDHCRVVGKYPGREKLRGLPGGRFIEPNQTATRSYLSTDHQRLSTNHPRNLR